MRLFSILDRLTPVQDFLVIVVIVFVLKVVFNIETIREVGVLAGCARELVSAIGYALVFVLVRRPFLTRMFTGGGPKPTVKQPISPPLDKRGENG